MEDYQEKLLELLGSGLEERISGKISEFGGLLTREAAVRLICRQNGIDTEKLLEISQALRSPFPFRFRAAVDRVFPVQTYPGRAGRSMRLHVSDTSGSATLVLWNGHVDEAEAHVSVGDRIECSGAFFRMGEIGMGREGKLAVLEKFPVLPVSRLTAGACSVEGEVGEIEEDYVYIDRKSGVEKKLSSFQLCDPKGCRRVVVWSSPEGAAMPSKGDGLRLENVVFKNGEVHFNFASRMVVKTSIRELKGKLERVELAGGYCDFTIGGKKFKVEVSRALVLLGIKSVPQGVSPSTLVAIRMKALSGSEATYTVSDGGLERLALGR